MQQYDVQYFNPLNLERNCYNDKILNEILTNIYVNCSFPLNDCFSVVFFQKFNKH